MRFLKVGALVPMAAVCASLAACDVGGVNSTPTPAPTPTPSPSSTPTPAVPLTSSASFQPTISRARYLTGGGGSLQTVNAVAPSSNATFSFDAATDTYTIQDTSSGQTISASFGAADKTATSAYAAAYSKTAAGVTDTLTLYGNARAGTTGTAPILLSYTSFGLWTQSNGGQVATTFFVFGQPTLAANVPLSGTASYQTFVAARKLEMNFVPLSDTNITGTATFSADFGSGKVSTMLSLIGKTFDGAGTISGNAFSGGLNDGATLNVGQFIGGFYGPAAQEMGYGFRISLHNPDPFAGAAPAPGDTYLTGVVVGAKQ